MSAAPLDLRGWKVRPFATIQADVRVEVQHALDNCHHYHKGVESEYAVAMLLEVDRLRGLLCRLHNAFRVVDWHDLVHDDPALAREIDAVILESA